MKLRHIKRPFLTLILTGILGLSRLISPQIETLNCRLDQSLSRAITASKPFTDALGGIEVSDLAFVNDHTLVFSGFSRPNISDTLSLQHIQLDLRTGNAQRLPPPNYKPLRTLYNQNYQVHVLSQSPDQRWQLAYIKGAQHFRELWLISKTYQERLDDRVPWGLNVQWSRDSSILWVTWIAIEAGEDGGLISLNNGRGVSTKFFQSPRDLRPLVNEVTISPERGRILITGANSNYVANGLFSEYEVIRGKLVMRMSQQMSPNLIRAGWNTATKGEFLVFADGKTLDVTLRDGTHLMQLGGEGYQAVLGQMGQMVRNYYGKPPVVAYSESKRYMAVALGSLFVYSCKANSGDNAA